MSEPIHATPSSPIGIFDSGIGGLTVVQCMQQHLANETLCYFGDTARVPYGTKSPDTVKRYSLEIVEFLKTHEVKIVVVACNTASSLALDEVKAAFDGPVIGVVEPGVRAGAAATRNGRIGVIGTRGTIRSGAYQRRLQQIDPSFHIAAAPCPLFVPLVEEGWIDHAVAERVAEEYLAPLRNEKVDVLILGCTHYPVLSKVIGRVMGEGVALVNSAEEVTREVSQRLGELGLLSETRRYQNLYYASDDIEGFKRLYQRICGKEQGIFLEAPADYFTLVQQLHKYRGRLFTSAAQWFEPMS
ncbi:MAG: glutamate racemase [bacterium]|nr:glutamate racemase [bacterium]